MLENNPRYTNKMEGMQRMCSFSDNWEGGNNTGFRYINGTEGEIEEAEHILGIPTIL